MKRARVKTVDAGSATTYAGLSLMSAAFAWWVTYYSQWGGLLGHLDMKLSCVSATASSVPISNNSSGRRSCPPIRRCCCGWAWW